MHAQFCACTYACTHACTRMYTHVYARSYPPGPFNQSWSVSLASARNAQGLHGSSWSHLLYQDNPRMQVHTCILKHVCANPGLQTDTCKHAHTRMYACVRACTCGEVHAYGHVYGCGRDRARKCIHAHKCTYASICIRWADISSMGLLNDRSPHGAPRDSPGAPGSPFCAKIARACRCIPAHLGMYAQVCSWRDTALAAGGEARPARLPFGRRWPPKRPTNGAPRDFPGALGSPFSVPR